jgi:hypothetical protein
MKAPNTQISSPQVSRCKHCAGKIYWDKTADGKWFPRNVYIMDGKCFIAWGRPRRHDCRSEVQDRLAAALKREAQLDEELTVMNNDALDVELLRGRSEEGDELVEMQLQTLHKKMDVNTLLLADTRRYIGCLQEMLAKR